MGRSTRGRDPRPGTALTTAIADTAQPGCAQPQLRPSLTASLEGAAATAPPRGARWNGWLGDHLGTGPRHRRAQPRLARARRLAARCCSVKAIGIAGAQSARALTWVEPQGTSTPDPLHAMQFRPPPHRSSRRCAQPNGLLEVTVTDRRIPLVPAACGTWVARPTRTRQSRASTNSRLSMLPLAVARSSAHHPAWRSPTCRSDRDGEVVKMTQGQPGWGDRRPGWDLDPADGRQQRGESLEPRRWLPISGQSCLSGDHR